MALGLNNVCNRLDKMNNNDEGPCCSKKAILEISDTYVIANDEMVNVTEEMM